MSCCRDARRVGHDHPPHHRISHSDDRLVVAALCAYLQVGYGFGFLYRAIDLASDVPFFSEGRMAGLFEYLYFSFITLTTVGYGDLTPAGDLGRSLVILEALLGQVLLVVLVAYLVGNLAKERHRPTE